jgi:aminoglycoside 6'-N-acetyltransferase I
MAAVVRRLCPGDVQLLVDAGAEVFDAAVSRERAAGFLADPRHRLVGAIVGGRLVGFASGVVCLHPDKPPQLFVAEVGVAPRLQRRGLGKALLEAMLAEARGAGCDHAWVATEVTNAPAQALYLGAGGVADAEPATVFTFRLDPPPAPAAGAAPR